jgi:hypothetical protein
LAGGQKRRRQYRTGGGISSDRRSMTRRSANKIAVIWAVDINPESDSSIPEKIPGHSG